MSVITLFRKNKVREAIDLTKTIQPVIDENHLAKAVGLSCDGQTAVYVDVVSSRPTDPAIDQFICVQTVMGRTIAMPLISWAGGINLNRLTNIHCGTFIPIITTAMVSDLSTNRLTKTAEWVIKLDMVTSICLIDHTNLLYPRIVLKTSTGSIMLGNNAIVKTE